MVEDAIINRLYAKNGAVDGGGKTGMSKKKVNKVGRKKNR